MVVLVAGDGIQHKLPMLNPLDNHFYFETRQFHISINEKSMHHFFIRYLTFS